jgi:hypothetical protein
MEDYYTAYKLIPKMGISWLTPSFFALVGLWLLMYQVKVKEEIFALNTFIGVIFTFAGICFPFILYKKESFDYHDIKSKISKKQYKSIKGEVEEFIPLYGKGKESFMIQGVRFEYDDFHDIQGFHQSCAQGGPICKNGLDVDIKYVEYQYGNNIIELRIKKDLK